MIDISIVICTYDRAESLRETLESILALKMDTTISHEVVVVDNNSKDHTKQIVENFQKISRAPVRYSFEPRQGVAFARNTGIRDSMGHIIAYLDDDVVIDPGWLTGLYQCFTQTQADAVGGRIARRWDCDKPDWYSEELGGCLISQELGLERKPWTDHRRHMVTANMAFKRSVFERFGTFQENLGRRGNSLLGGEDRELYQRLVKSQGIVMYEPLALAYHKVEKERLNQPYFRQWFFQIGQTLGHEMSFKVTIAPVWVWNNALKALLRHLSGKFLPGKNPAERFAGEIWLLYHHGIISERFAHWLPFGWGNKACAFHISKW